MSKHLSESKNLEKLLKTAMFLPNLTSRSMPFVHRISWVVTPMSCHPNLIRPSADELSKTRQPPKRRAKEHPQVLTQVNILSYPLANEVEPAMFTKIVSGPSAITANELAAWAKGWTWQSLINSFPLHRRRPKHCPQIVRTFPPFAFGSCPRERVQMILLDCLGKVANFSPAEFK